MISIKNSQLAGRCQTLRDHYDRIRQQFDYVRDQRSQLGDEIDSLTQQIFSSKDPQDLERLHKLQRDAHNRFKPVEREYQALRRQLQAAQNDYEITGCHPILGPLHLGYR